MIPTLYLDAKLDKQLRALRREGKKAALAAEQAQDIIAKLRGGRFASMEAGSTTKNGELRLKGCLKYDLGSGYRMVTLKQGRDLYVLHIGSHDDCHRWLENNRDFSVEQVKKRYSKLRMAAGDIPCDVPEDAAAEAQEEDYDPLTNISEKNLRHIFRGIVDTL